MNEKYIRQLIRLVEESKIESLEISTWRRRIKITQPVATSSNGHSDQPTVVSRGSTPPAPVQPLPAGQTTSTVEAAAAEETDRLVEIKSPMVGTFYSAPAPDADSYVSLNQKISVGQVVCIVEAMKLMNEIESEVSGRVAKICVGNAEPVEFGQTIFLIDPE
ncbi:MAG: acetyl-CoA carboxylase biotin carboxyl carrier protein [bacterium]